MHLSWQDAILYGPGWAAIPLMLLNHFAERRFRRRYRERWGVDPTP